MVNGEKGELTNIVREEKKIQGYKKKFWLARSVYKLILLIVCSLQCLFVK